MLLLAHLLRISVPSGAEVVHRPRTHVPYAPLLCQIATTELPVTQAPATTTAILAARRSATQGLPMLCGKLEVVHKRWEGGGGSRCLQVSPSALGHKGNPKQERPCALGASGLFVTAPSLEPKPGLVLP